MLRKAAVLGACAMWLTFAFGIGAAHAADPHYTDGSQCQGPFCGGAPNPPPTNPVWEVGQECHIDIVDPSGVVFMTEHFVYGTTPPPAGVVPVTDDASMTFPYHGVAPAEFPIDVTQFVAGKQGFRADTWNIGTGVTVWEPFDCTSDASTTTTAPTSTTSTTVEPTTTTTIQTEGSTTIPSSTTSTTIATEGSTVAPPSTTVPDGPLGSTVPPTASDSLPFTGSGSAPLAGIGGALVLAGVGAVTARRRLNRR